MDKLGVDLRRFLPLRTALFVLPPLEASGKGLTKAAPVETTRFQFFTSGKSPLKRATVAIVFLITLLVGANAVVSAVTDEGRGNELQGTIWVGRSASGEALRILSTEYTLRRLTPESAAGHIVIGGASLKIPWVIDRLKAAYEAHYAVGLTNAPPADIERLRALLGHRGSAGHPEGKTVDLAAFRKASRPDGQSHFRSHILLPRITSVGDVSMPQPLADSTVADSPEITGLNRIFSATPEVPEPPPPSSDGQQNLLNLAESYESHATQTDANGNAVQLVNTVWAARSFLNSADFYYILQETDYTAAAPVTPPPVTSWQNQVVTSAPYPNITLLQPSPETTREATQVTSGVSESIGVSVGWNATQGFNASVSETTTISNSKTVTVPAISILNDADLSTGSTNWQYTVNDLSALGTISFFSQWIWQVPFSSYAGAEDNPDFVFNSTAILNTNNANLEAQLSPSVPKPFDLVFSLEPPVVTGVSPSCVDSGDQFTIQGTGLYPSLVESVIIGGTPVAPDNVTTVSDTQINVIAPDTVECHGSGCPVVVQTTQGTSNTDVNIVISSFCD